MLKKLYDQIYLKILETLSSPRSCPLNYLKLWLAHFYNVTLSSTDKCDEAFDGESIKTKKCIATPTALCSDIYIEFSFISGVNV